MKSTAWILCLFLVIGVAVYGNSLSNPFHYDDAVTVVGNKNIRTLSNIPRFFTDPRTATATWLPSEAGHYRPLVVLSYAVNYAAGGLDPVGYHLVNLAFHAGSAFLIFLIVQSMLTPAIAIPGRGSGRKEEVAGIGALWASLAAGLIFLVHPFNSEAVNYITARSSLMSGFFYLLGFYCWVRFRKAGAARFYAVSLLAFAGGMLSKEVAITLPVVLWMYDLCFVHPLRTTESVFRKLLNWRGFIPYLPFILIVAVPYLIIRGSSFGKVVPHFTRDLWTQLFTELPVLVAHWKFFLWPGGLSLMHDAEIYRTVTWTVMLSGLLLLIYTGMSLYLAFLKELRWRIISFFMLWFIIVLLPTTIIPLNIIFQENRGYLTVVCFAVIAGLFMELLHRKAGWKITACAILILMLSYSAATVSRNRVWGDDLVLWKDTVEKAPATSDAYAGLAGVYKERRDFFLSLETAKKGISVDPDNASLWLHLGQIYEVFGDLDQAVLNYKKAVEADPIQAYIWKDLAMVYIKKGDMERAESSLMEALKLRSDDPSFYYHLARVIAEMGRLGEAVDLLEEALSLQPGYIVARVELGMIFEKTGRTSEAIMQYQEAVRLGSARLRHQTLLPEEDKENTGQNPVDKSIEYARRRIKELTSQ
ncbi:MAG: tetratricopeptide repeat protein [Nitrospirae bacterium]|nr:tetratricopeptide repeat protein [Nitrospirota bacterium]